MRLLPFQPVLLPDTAAACPPWQARSQVPAHGMMREKHARTTHRARGGIGVSLDHGPDFPDGFMFGAATSSHQVEGGNDRNDWWAFEARGGSKDRSGDACDHWHLYPDDIRLLRDLGLNSYRFSLEWSRIEPEPGLFDPAALDHYRRMADTCRELGVEPLPTLHHFTLPLWLSERGGVLARNSSALFARYATEAARALKDSAHWVVTINEPAVLALMGYVEGVWPPGERRPLRAARVLERLVRWHLDAVAAIRSVAPDMLLGVAKHWIDFVPHDPARFGHRLGARLQDALFNRRYLDRTAAKSDFIGLNYYSRNYTTGPISRVPLARLGDPHTAMGWSIVPEGLLAALRRLGNYRLPVLICENGIATDDDAQRVDYLLAHLGAVRDALREGVQVIGYQHWSLLDNFEWAEGFWPKFGLVAVDPQTQERTVRQSATFYGEIARARSLPDSVAAPR